MDLLAGHGSWAGRAEIDGAVGFSASRIDDELALLVMAGAVLYNDRAREYRLAGTPLARQAARLLLADGLERRVLSHVPRDGGATRVALAMRDAQGALVMAELELPGTAGDLAAQMTLLDRVRATLAPATPTETPTEAPA